MAHPQHQIWELLRKHFTDEKADFIVSIVAPFLEPATVKCETCNGTGEVTHPEGGPQFECSDCSPTFRATKAGLADRPAVGNSNGEEPPMEIYVTAIRHWDYQTETDSDGLHVVYGYWNDEGWWHVTNWMVPPCITSA